MREISIDELENAFANQSIMRGIGFDISNSNSLKSDEKDELIRACERLLYYGIPLQKCHKNLLWKVRKEYHIVLSGLDSQAEPSSFWDKLRY